MATNEQTKRALFFQSKVTLVHVKTKDNFYNGYIMEIIGEDHIILKDRMLGEIPIYFSEIILIEPYKVRRKEDETKRKRSF